MSERLEFQRGPQQRRFVEGVFGPIVVTVEEFGYLASDLMDQGMPVPSALLREAGQATAQEVAA